MKTAHEQDLLAWAEERNLDVDFKHIRRHDMNGFILTPTGGKTICTLIDKGGNFVVQGVALCNPAENYNKAIGRSIALGRARKNLQRKLNQLS